MNIVTNTYGLSTTDLFKILFSIRMRRLRWVIWVVLAGVITTLLLKEYIYTTVFVVYLVISFAVSIFGIYFFANNSKNNPLRMERHVKIDKKGITATVIDGRSQTTSWDEIGRKWIVGEYYLLMSGPQAFLYIHYAAFKTEEDHQAFREFIGIK